MDIFIVGMFRSGTTLVSKMLDAHKRISVVADPAMFFFKALRNKVAAQLQLNIDPREPITGSYFPVNWTLWEKTWEVSLNLELSNQERLNISEDIGGFVYDFCPLIIPHLRSVQGGTYFEYYSNLLNLAKEKYKKRDSDLFGTKEAWCEGFVLPLSNFFPDMKFVFLVRDPRAVVASKNAEQNNQEPLLFLIRQWRESIMNIMYFSKIHPEIRQRSLIVKYEDLTTYPSGTASEMCDFLGVEFSPKMLDSSQFRDGKGNIWQANTSHKMFKQGVSNESMDKWKNALNEDHIACIEKLCAPEMALLGYKSFAEPMSDYNDCFNTPEVDYEKLTPWIKELQASRHLREEDYFTEEMAKESSRLDMLKDDSSAQNNKLSEEAVQRFFLCKEYYNMLSTVA